MTAAAVVVAGWCLAAVVALALGRTPTRDMPNR